MAVALAGQLREGTKKSHTMAENTGFVACFLKGVFEKKSYSFKLSAKVENSKTTYHTKSGWIIKLTSNDKKIGFGEVSPLNKEDLKKCAKQLDMIPEYVEVFNLSEQI